MTPKPPPFEELTRMQQIILVWAARRGSPFTLADVIRELKPDVDRYGEEFVLAALRDGTWSPPCPDTP